jgi:DNA-directed RNA polymerase II subunit RPB2
MLKVEADARARQVCHLSKKNPGSDLPPNHKELAAMSECIYDQGGYFVVNGSEKVLIAQERRANNMVKPLPRCSPLPRSSPPPPPPNRQVFVFKRRPPGPTHMAEIVSFTEKGNKPVSVLYLKLCNVDVVKSKREVGVSVNRRIMCKMPYIKEDVPVVFVFRALGFCEDKEILQMVRLSNYFLLVLFSPLFCCRFATVYATSRC